MTDLHERQHRTALKVGRRGKLHQLPPIDHAQYKPIRRRDMEQIGEKLLGEPGEIIGPTKLGAASENRGETLSAEAELGRHVSQRVLSFFEALLYLGCRASGRGLPVFLMA